MKKTNLIDLIRFIKKTIVSFLSIGIFMGVSFAVFLGIFSAAQSLRDSTERSYQGQRFSDMQIASSLGFSEDDLTALKQLDCVADAQGSRETFGWTNFQDARHLTYFMEYSENLNKYKLIEGRLPQRADECAIDYSLDYNGLKIGSVIAVEPVDDRATGLVRSKLTVTGFVTHPYALSKDKDNRRGFAPYGDGSVYCFMLLSPNAFDDQFFADSYTSAYVAVKGADGYSSFSKQYKQQVDDAKNSIETLGKTRSDLRYKDLREQASTAVDKAEMLVAISMASDASKAVLTKAQDQLDAIEPADWALLDRRTNTSFLEVEAFATSLTNISWSFSIIFIIVAVIIIFTMLSRLIDEQRVYTGIKKSVGFKTHEILNFFLLYSTLSSLIGVAIGLPLCFFIEELAYDSYAGRFWFTNQGGLSFLPGWALAVYGALTLIAVLSTAFAVFSSAAESPTTLLLGEKPPRNTARVIKRLVPNWNKLNTFSKMIFCNIFSNPKRLLSVISGVAGSLSLLLIGMLVHSSITRVPVEQARITLYDQLIVCDDTRQVQRILDRTPGVRYLKTKETNCAFEYKDLLGAATLACLTPGYEDYLQLKDTVGNRLQLPTDSALISTKIAELNGLKVGSELKLVNSGGSTTTLKVGGIFQHFTYNSVVLSPQYYQQVFGEAPNLSQFYVNFGPEVSAERQKELLDSVKGAAGFLAAKRANRYDGYFLDMAENLMTVLMILIVLAAFLIAVVIYNTVVMNIVRRKAELAMLQLNGFSARDIRRYISSEFWVMAIFGIILGTVLGGYLSTAVEKVVEPIYCQFVRTPSLTVCAQGVGLTLAMAVVLNFLAMRMLKRIKITDAMK